MLIDTTRFGQIEVDETRTIHFAKGILGFSEHTDFALLDAGEEGTFYWLQSTTLPELAFVVADPAMFVPSYQAPLRPEQLESLGIASADRAQVFVIVNKHEHSLTGNLQGPLIVGLQSRQAEQLVLSDRRFTTRVPLLELSQPQPVAMSA